MTANTPYEALRDAAAALIREGADASTLESAATVLKDVVESEKVVAETHNIRRNASSEAFRFYVPIIAPLVSALAVVAALVFQTIQFRETSRLQARTVELQDQTVKLQAKSAEDAAWRETIRTLTGSPTVINGIAGGTLLGAFLTSGQHVEEARSFALSVLGEVQFSTLFKSLFLKALEATPQDEKLVVMADLSVRLRRTYNRLDLAANDLRPKPNPDLPTLFGPGGKEFPNPLFAGFCQVWCMTRRSGGDPADLLTA